MRIQHNIMAMNAYRNYNTNTSALSKNLEKLSSGYKINRAGDDAAGLAISEKMRAQITGLNAAQKNVKDGISLVKTGEGAMQEIQDMLNRMDYLATQSANGTYDDPVDRANLQKEVEALKSEINRIADSANFNGINLLDGSLEDGATISPSLGLPSVGSIVGVNTVLHVEPSSDTAGSEFQIDLGNLAVASASVAGDIKITVTIGKNTYEIDASAGMSTAAIASAVKAAIIEKGFVDASGKSWTVASDATTAATLGIAVTSGTIKFTQAKAPTKKDEVVDIPASVKVSISGSTWATRDNNVSTGQDYNAAITAQKHVGLSDGERLASTYFQLTKNMVQPGATLRIGDETYTFTDNKAYKDNYSKGMIYVGDLDLATAEGMKIAAMRLTKVAESTGNDYFTVGFDGNHVTIREKAGAITYDSQTGKGSPYDLTTLEGFKSALSANAGSGQALTLQIGDTADSYNQLKVSIGDMHTAAMGIEDVDISSQAGAQAAIQTIRNAINYVSGVRGDLGAVQNRLEHTQNNLSVMAENIQDAESTIRDTDVAEEMMSYVKNNILVQSAQAMLAQANQVPQGVLQLLG